MRLHVRRPAAVVVVLDYSRDVLPPPSPAAAEFAPAPWQRRSGRVSCERSDGSGRPSCRGRHGAVRA